MIEYTNQLTMSEAKQWDHLPDNMVPELENEDFVKVVLIDKKPFQTVHTPKEKLEECEWDSVEEFRKDVDWETVETIEHTEKFMNDNEHADDEQTLEQKALDDLDLIASEAEQAIQASMRGDEGEVDSHLHEIYDTARSWEDEGSPDDVEPAARPIEDVHGWSEEDESEDD